MTMETGKCDVCNTNEAIGVASTAVPLSVAYCLECAQRNAQPMCVFLMWEEDIPPKDHACPNHMFTYEDGKYISYSKWYYKRQKNGTQGTVPKPKQDG